MFKVRFHSKPGLFPVRRGLCDSMQGRLLCQRIHLHPLHAWRVGPCVRRTEGTDRKHLDSKDNTSPMYNHLFNFDSFGGHSQVIKARNFYSRIYSWPVRNFGMDQLGPALLLRVSSVRPPELDIISLDGRDRLQLSPQPHEFACLPHHHSQRCRILILVLEKLNKQMHINNFGFPELLDHFQAFPAYDVQVLRISVF